jgi:hypothetical protein
MSARTTTPLRLRALLSACLVLACACAATPRVPPGIVVGEDIVPREIVGYVRLDASPEDYLEQTLLVEATVTAVCIKKGCWMQIEDGGRKAMVRWESGCGGKYAFPAEAVGRRVVIQGSFYPKTISAEDAEHLQSESADGVVIAREGYELNASAVLLLDV